MSRTLIVYLHGIGDNIMLSGVLKEYGRQHPDEKIDLMVLNAGCAAIWNNNPLVHSVTLYPGRQPHFWNPVLFYLFHQWTVRRHVRQLNYDGRYQRVLFPTIQTLPEILYHLTGSYGRHKMDRLSRAVGVSAELYPYDLHPTDAEKAAAAERIDALGGKPLAVLHPFSGHTKKRIGVRGFEKILETLREHGFTTLVVGSPNEQRQWDAGCQTESAFGLPFGVLAEILKGAKLFAGTDSVVAHLAAFANTPRLVIFSPKLKPDRYRPISEHSRVTFVRISLDGAMPSLSELSDASE